MNSSKYFFLLTPMLFFLLGNTKWVRSLPASSAAADPRLSAALPAPIVIDHNSTDLDLIPEYWIEQAKELLRVSYGHTSHGSQLISGMGALSDGLFAFNTTGAVEVGILSIADYTPSGDLGSADWDVRTREYLLGSGADRNVVMWSWCGQANTSNPAYIQSYLDRMNQLETEFPDVLFVYMTGHLDSGGNNDTINARNGQIRDFVQANNRILFDFADIESYDPDGNYYPNGTDACLWCSTWCTNHPEDCTDLPGSCAHSHPFNCYRKGKAAWWLFARLAGWSGTAVAPGNFNKTAPADGSTVSAAPDLSWTDSTGVEDYAYCIDTIDNDVCDGSWVDAGTATSVSPAGLMDGETYYWTVAANNGGGTTYADGGTWWSFTILPDPPGPFGKTSPADAGQDSTHPTLTWEAGSGAASYEYCIDETDDDACGSSWISTGSSQSAALSGLTADTTYFWQVRVGNAGGTVEADGGTWWSFTANYKSFDDVPVGHWAWSYIERLFAAGITGGCGGGNYCPGTMVTRAQMAVFLERGMQGSSYTPPPASGTVFGDVTTGTWGAAWIEQLFADGITSGCGGGNYCPATAVTRAQMAVFLLRAKHGSAYAPPSASGTVFGDVTTGTWGAAWIEQLNAEGITGGCGGGNYCPSQSVTRASMAVLLVRTFNLP